MRFVLLLVAAASVSCGPDAPPALARGGLGVELPVTLHWVDSGEQVQLGGCTMFVVVDPECGACRALAADPPLWQPAGQNVPVYWLSVSDSIDSTQFAQEFSLELSQVAFGAWQRHGSLSERLASLGVGATPGAILLDSAGVLREARLYDGPPHESAISEFCQ